jgi:hypothetical protein
MEELNTFKKLIFKKDSKEILCWIPPRVISSNKEWKEIVK